MFRWLRSLLTGAPCASTGPQATQTPWNLSGSGTTRRTATPTEEAPCEVTRSLVLPGLPEGAAYPGEQLPAAATPASQVATPPAAGAHAGEGGGEDVVQSPWTTPDQARYVIQDGQVVGVANTTRKNLPNRMVRAHMTPFDQRLERKIQEEAAALQEAVPMKQDSC